MISYIVNGLIYYFGWFLCVYLGGIGYSLSASGIALLLIGGQVAVTFFKERGLFYLDLRLAGVALVLGVFMEMGFIKYGLLRYHEGIYFPPLWLTLLYPLFAITLNHSLSWINRFIGLPFVLGGIGAPLSYRAGVALHAVVIKEPEISSLIVVGVFWGCYLTLILMINQSFKKS